MTSTWLEEFDEHPVHAVINTLRELLESLAEGGIQNEADVDRHRLDRIHHLLSYVEQRLGLADKGLVYPQVLTELKGLLDKATAHMGNAVSQKSGGHLLNVVNLAPAVLQKLAQVPQIETETDLKRLADAQDRLGLATLEVVDGLRASLKDERDRYAHLETKTSAVEVSLAKLGASIEGQKARLDEAIAAFQKQFSEAEAARAAANEASRHDAEAKALGTINTWEKAFEDSLAGLREEAHTFRKEENEDAKNHLQEMKSSEGQARELLGIASNIAVTGEFHKAADAESAAADTWRRVSLFFNVVLVVALGYFIFETTATGYTLELAASRLVMLFILLFPTHYAAKESTKHRDSARRNKRMQLELASIGPYLESLPAEQAQKLKVELARKFFGQADEVRPEASDDGGDVVKMFGIVNRFFPKP